jgi:hypothetical protein
MGSVPLNLTDDKIGQKNFLQILKSKMGANKKSHTGVPL